MRYVKWLAYAGLLTLTAACAEQSGSSPTTYGYSGGYYDQPAYSQSQPGYYQSQPYYYGQPGYYSQPIYYGQPTYYSQPIYRPVIYYAPAPAHHHHHHHHGRWCDASGDGIPGGASPSVCGS